MEKSIKEFPKPIPLSKLFGPSFILLGLGLGSGEVVLWPSLVAKFGLGIIWAAILGISFQFIINMEVERYTLIKGESIFAGFYKKWGKKMSIWLMMATFIPWLWPGIISSSAFLISKALGFEHHSLVTIIFLVLIGIIYSTGKFLYLLQERVQKAIIIIGVPVIFLLTFALSKTTHLTDLLKGFLGIGNGYNFIPPNLSFAALLGALAYSGAGGTLNLAQSYYVKEKGYGMGIYAKKLLGISSNDHYQLTNFSYEENQENNMRIKIWWQRINIEHAVIFFLTGALTISVLALLSYITAYSKTTSEGLSFILTEVQYISLEFGNILGTLVLFLLAIMLFGTQFAVYGSTSRILSENFILSFPSKAKNDSKLFFIFLWLQITISIIVTLFGFTEPLTLITLSAVLNAFSMFVYSIFLIIINRTEIPNPFKINSLRIFFMVLAISTYFLLFLLTLSKYLR